MTLVHSAQERVIPTERGLRLVVARLMFEGVRKPYKRGVTLYCEARAADVQAIVSYAHSLEMQRDRLGNALREMLPEFPRDPANGSSPTFEQAEEARSALLFALALDNEASAFSAAMGDPTTANSVGTKAQAEVNQTNQVTP